MGRDTYAQIDLNRLGLNLEVLKEQSQTDVFGVVKANAYGHGMLPIAKYLEDKNVPFLCVSSIDEALELVKHGTICDILIFSYVAADDIEAYHHEQFVYTVPSLSWFETVKDFKTPLRLHVEINTGMNRYGVKDDAIASLFNTHHTIEGVYNHFNSPQISPTTHEQLKRFKAVVDGLPKSVQWIHCGNAPLSFLAENEWINGSRFGLGLYGYRSDCGELKPILSLFSKVNHVDRLNEGDTLGYDGTYTALVNSSFASIPIGYGDGFDLRNTETDVYINNQPYTIKGKVCMDQIMVIADDAISVGNRVELIGENRTCNQIEALTGMSIYIQLTALSHRIRRIYIK